MASFGDRLEQLLHEKRVSASTLAKRMGVVRQTIYRWISDESLPKDQETWDHLANLLGTSVEYLRDGKTHAEVDWSLAFQVLALIEAEALKQDLTLTNEIRAKIAATVMPSSLSLKEPDATLIRNVVSMLKAA